MIARRTGVVVHEHADRIAAEIRGQHARCRTDARLESKCFHSGARPDAAARELPRLCIVEQIHHIRRAYRASLDIVEQLIVALRDNRQRHVVADADLRMLPDHPTDDSFVGAPNVQRVRQHDRFF